MSGSRWRIFGCALLALTIVGRSAVARIVIDEFVSASNTLFITDTNVAATTLLPVIASDSGLGDVLGGVRQLTVQATSLGDFDKIVAGVVPLASFFEYNSTAAADGLITLRYDRGGTGLNASFVPDLGIRIIVVDADAAAVPYTVTVALTDGAANSGSLTRTVFVPGGPMFLTFPFKHYPGVDLSNIASVQVTVDAQVAADLRLDRIETYGPTDSPFTTPLMSQSAVVVLIATLAFLGLRTLLRSH